MSKVISHPYKEVEVDCKSAYCKNCDHQVIFWQDTNEEFHTGFHSEENEKLVGQPCEICEEGKYVEQGTFTLHRKPRTIEVICNCNSRFTIQYDGQKCRKCGQMYNALGQEITHRGYNEYGDINEYDY